MIFETNWPEKIRDPISPKKNSKESNPRLGKQKPWKVWKNGIIMRQRQAQTTETGVNEIWREKKIISIHNKVNDISLRQQEETLGGQYDNRRHRFIDKTREKLVDTKDISIETIVETLAGYTSE